MTPDLDHRLDLAGQILCLLREHPEGLSEYQLIQLLKARHSTHIPHRELADKLVLFRTHFLLFNALYHLRDHLWAEHEAHLEISPLSLRLHPYVDGTQALEQGDPLRDYYLDLRHLGRPARPTSSGCCRVSGRACRAARRRLPPSPCSSLEGAVDYPAIKLRYRQLVSQHHPDRGGSTARLQSINKAMEILQRYYSRP